jgi:hypothetical protein
MSEIPPGWAPEKWAVLTRAQRRNAWKVARAVQKRQRPYQPSTYVAVDIPPHASAELTAQAVAWLAANGIDADDVPRSKPVKISDGPEPGTELITYARVIRLRNGTAMLMGRGGPIATEPVTVPLVERLPVALQRHTRIVIGEEEKTWP